MSKERQRGVSTYPQQFTPWRPVVSYTVFMYKGSFVSGEMYKAAINQILKIMRDNKS